MSKNKKSWLALVALATVSAWMAACAHSPAGPCENPPPFHVTLEASPRLNPDAHGRPLPTTVELYQLKAASKLERLDFKQLERKPQESLGDDLLKVDELTVDPGQSVSQWLVRDAKATQLLAVASVRQPSGTSWRQLATLPSPSPEQCAAPPKPTVGSPKQEDIQLRFFLEDFDIRTPVKHERSNR